jgi:hypothetical protein
VAADSDPSSLADPIPPVSRAAAFQRTCHGGGGLRLGGELDPGEEEGIGGLRWQSWRGVVFGRRAFEGEEHTAALLHLKVDGGGCSGGASSLIGHGRNMVFLCFLF